MTIIIGKCLFSFFSFIILFDIDKNLTGVVSGNGEPEAGDAAPDGEEHAYGDGEEEVAQPRAGIKGRSEKYNRAV